MKSATLVPIETDFYSVSVSPTHGVFIFRSPVNRPWVHPFSRPDYSREEAQQVVDWLNGNDKPLPYINGKDFPGHPRRRA